MMARGTVHRLVHDTGGGSVIEFALLAPAMIAMLMGIFWIGVQMRSYNELRSIVSDVSRYTVVEYQKSNKLTTQQISDVASATAIRAPYNLAGSNLDVSVVQQASPVAGATEFQITLSYTAPNFLDFLGIGAPVQTFSQSVFVPA